MFLFYSLSSAKEREEKNEMGEKIKLPVVWKAGYGNKKKDQR